MKTEVYKTLVADIRNYSGLTRDCADVLIRKYDNIPLESIHSILSTEAIHRVKTNRKKLYSIRYDFMRQYEINKVNGSPGSGVRLAASLNLPPTLVARSILEYYHNSNADTTVSRTDINQYLKDPALVGDPDLAYEIYLCILYDDRNGFISNAFSLAIGYEYEMKLHVYLEDRKIAFLTEDKLRDRGYDKTPDVKLEIPIAVNGFIINWIESKARFGSPFIHETHVKKQFLSYWNRFGPGLVIYWFDYVDDIIDPSERKFIVMNHFPENITYMDPTVL